MVSNSAMIAQRYVSSADSGTIIKETLFKLPSLVNVTNWKKLSVVGSINFAQKSPPLHYYGILGKYQGGLYYIRQAVVDQLSQFDRQFKHIRKTIKVG